ncbi:MAG TPA: alpha-glucan family phosphorylase [Mycobacteriales bacterium]|nr:alpha-glucan family phosphorylase [Mycobacteriales bacterium]
MKALRRFTVRTRLPEPLLPLGELVMNLRWSWHAPTQDLFSTVSPDVWAAVRHDPVRLLGEVPPERMDSLAADSEFLARLTAARADLEGYLTRPKWYQSLDSAPTSIAYFSPEYGITEVLPQYSGGLGILAGDHLKTASDLGIPIIGVGLLYRRGYFRQTLSADGWQLEHYPALDPHGLPVTQVAGEDGSPLKVEVGLPGGAKLYAQVWRAQVGRVPLLLLDSDIEENSPSEREVTDRLYGGGTDHRLLQEMLLGIGGVRALTAYGATPEVFHTNEGHAGFLGLERIRVLVDQDGLDFDTALEVVRAGTVFTTHTPVPAGIDRFPRELIERHFGGDNAAAGVPVERILELGDEPGGDGSVFNMAYMGLRLAQRANGVSRLHGEVSREMFAGLWPGFDPAEVPIRHVTNGVHAPTWVARPIMDIAQARDVTDAAHSWASIDSVSDQSAWELKRSLRSGLVDEVRRRVRESWLTRGANAAELRWTESVFDPDVLTIGFARRVPSYKRLTLILRDRDRLRTLLLDKDRPIQLVIAGKAHPADDGGKLLVQEIVRFADEVDVRHRIVFLPDYDIGMARHLYAGCDVWLNNPLRPLEACGTSGMKAALNGGLNLSILDGWWDELYDGSNGWAIPSAGSLVDPERRDDLEAKAIYELIETAVLPQFYNRDAAGIPTGWTAMVRHTLRSLGPAVLSTRMLRDYVNDLYSPAAQSSRAMSADGCAVGRGLADWRRTVVKSWPSVAVRHVESSGVGDSPELGARLTVRAVVDLGVLRPEDVEVHAAYGRVDESDQIAVAEVVPLTMAGDHGNGEWRYEGELPLRHTGPVGYTVRVLPRHPALVSSAELGLVTSA